MTSKFLAPLFDNIPQELIDRPSFVCWREKLKKGKLTKIPIDPNKGGPADCSKPSTWAQFHLAKDFFLSHRNGRGGIQGIGFELAKPHAGFDLDHCRNPETGEIEPWALDIITRLDSYTEISPSRTGVHIFIKGKILRPGNKKGKFEVYDSGRYLTVTGHHLAGTPLTVEPRQDVLNTIHKEFFPEEYKLKEASAPQTKKEKSRSPSMDDETIIQKAMNAANSPKFSNLWAGDWSGYRSQSEADEALCFILAFWTQDPAQIDRLFRLSGLMRPKWDRSVGQGRTYGQKTIEKALAGGKETYSPPEKAPLDHEAKGTEKRAGKSTQSETLLSHFKGTLRLFHDEDSEAYAYLKNEVVHLRSKKFKQFASRQFYKETGKTINNDSMNQVIQTMEGIAIFDQPEIKLFNRIASLDNLFWYDLGNGKAIRTTPDGWTKLDPPPLFRRYQHQTPQVVPVSGGDPFEVLTFLNLTEDQELLFLVYLISGLIPDIPHPILHAHGDQGSAKTGLCRIVKKLLDPSVMETIITPRDQRQLIQIIAHHRVCFFDNLSDLPPWFADILAQVCTGGGFSKRQNYTDDDDFIYRLRRSVGINSIELLITRPDLMDRAILLPMQRIPPAMRRRESEFWICFEQARPRILGSLFDVLTRAMGIFPNLHLSHLPRMADFFQWGYAIAEALGERGKEFADAYQHNVDHQHEEIIANSPLAQAVLKLMEDKTDWTGTIGTAYIEFCKTAGHTKDSSVPSFPRDERSLRNHLDRLRVNLIDAGITYSIGNRDHKTKFGVPLSFKKHE